MQHKTRYMIHLKWFLFLIIFILHLHQFSFSSAESRHHICNNEQRLALLQFKQSLTLDAEASSFCDDSLLYHPKTKSWNTTTEGCCKWSGVICDESTGNVIGLDLSCSQLKGKIDTNSSIFQLVHLDTLNLAYNDFSDSRVSPQFGRFTSLSSLNLSNSGFSGRISSNISRLFKLVSLDLSGNWEQLRLGQESIEFLTRNLTEITELYLSEVQINSVLPRNLSSSLVHLDLSHTGLKGELPAVIFELPNLVTLDLTGNGELTGHFPKINMNGSSRLEVLSLLGTGLFGQLPEPIGHLNSLKNLDLSECRFSGPIPQNLGNLTLLTDLKLYSNNFSGRLPFTVSNLKQLSQLDLSNNHLEGEIGDVLGYFTQVESLDLSVNSLTGPIPSNVSGFQNLALIFLQNNSLNGTMPSWLFNLPSLGYLDLSHNQLEGQIHEFRYNSLKFIDLSDNKLHGPIPQSISEQVNLTTIYLSSNNLSRNVEISMFSNLKQLRFLDLSYNNLSFGTKVGANLPNSLKSLWLSSCNIIEINFLTTIQLGKLDLSNNKIRGQIPDLSKWRSLQYLNLSGNFITSLNHSRIPWESLVYVDLRSNLLSGPLLVPPLNTFVFVISHNNLTGEIPPSICNSTSLGVIDLSHNNLSGIIPPCLITLSNKFSVLNLQMNGLSGSIPNTFKKDSRLRSLNLNGNRFVGTVPKSLANCRSLEVLDLGNNKFNGTFPRWLGTLPRLQILVLRSNRFHGPITRTSKNKLLSFEKLRILDLSYNEFIGPLPASVFKSFKAMMKVDENRIEPRYVGETYYQDSVTIVIKGQQLELARVLTIFTTIDLSNNKFEGEIPNVIGNLNSLRLLNLSHNGFVGSIPSLIGNLSVLESLDLSFNKLVGEIPQQLTNLTFLAVLNLSQNHLVGRIPQGNQFNTFQNDSYNGNLELCGFPLSKDCGNEYDEPGTSSVSEDEDDDDSNFASGFTWKAVLMGYGCGTVFGLGMGYIMFLIGKPKWFIRIVEGGRRRYTKRQKRN